MFNEKNLKFNNEYLIYFILISFLHVFFHYTSFDRSALAPDDYANIINLKGNYSNYSILEFFKTFNDRPISYLFIVKLHNYFNANVNYYFYTLIFSSLLLLISVFFLFILFTRDIKLSFILTIIYDLLPNKIETFHSSIFININFVSFLYICSIILFFLFYYKKKLIFIFTSYLIYFIAVFWYEVGFFIPLIFLFFIYLFNKKYLKYYSYLLMPFFAIMIFYFCYRNNFFYSNLDGFSNKSINLYLFPHVIIEIFNSFIGRYNIRSIIYGIYMFFNLNIFSIVILSVINITIFMFYYLLFKKIKISKIDNKSILFFLLFTLITLIPNILYGGFGGRHALLPSVSFVLIIYFVILFINKKYFKQIITSIVFIGLFISQGNALSHSISLRIINSFYETLEENSINLISSNNIIIDVHSFKKNIPYSLLNNEYNNFNTYFGAQLFENWGILSIISLATNKNIHDNIFISSSNIDINNNKVKFYVNKQTGYNQVNKELIEINNNKLFLVDYNLVYKNGYYLGNRDPE